MRSIDFKAVAAVTMASALLLASGSQPVQAQERAARGLRASTAITSEARQDTPALERDDDGDGWRRSVLRIGQDFTLRQGEAVREVVVVLSPASLDGYVRGDVTVVLGTVRLGPTAVIDGSLVVVGGNVIVQPGASVRHDLVVVGGGLDAPDNFAAGHQHVAIGAAVIVDRLQDMIPWLTQGLLLGRPIAPRLPWIWGIVFFAFLVSLALTLLFADTVRTCANAIAARPFTTFLVGLLVLLLTGPVSVILIASVIGIAVAPFALCAVVIAGIIGQVGVAMRLGDVMTGQPSLATRLQSLRSVTLGFAAICLIYVVPVLGIIAWAFVGVIGLGAAALAFTSSYRRENPAPPRPAPPPRPPDNGSLDLGVTPPDLPPAAALPNGTAAAIDTPASQVFAPASATNLLAFPKARFLERAAAFALDTAFIFIICGTLGLMEDNAGPVLLIMLAYHVGFWAWKSTTFGGIVCQLRVIRLDGSRLRSIDAIVRGIAGIFSLGVLGLGCLWIVRDPERQSWHDKIAGTYVVTVPRNWPLL